MNKPFDYMGVFASYMNGYVRMKESCGFKIISTKWFFKEFDDFTISIGMDEPKLTQELIEEWRKSRVNDCNRTLSNKYSHLACFGRYLNEHGVKAYITPIPKCTNRRGFVPYIFSEEQMASIFAESNTLLRESHRKDDPIISIPCLIRLLYSTGMRISEAISLHNDDVDFDNNVIRVGHYVETKNGEERYVPISTSLRKVMTDYVSFRNKIKAKNIDSPHHLFFVKLNGTEISTACVYKWFRKVYERCGIAYRGDRFGPRVHDLRHSMATNTLNRMIKDGWDVYSVLPVLSACLGHKSISATERYVRLTCEYYPELLRQCATLSDFIYSQNDETE